MPLRRPFLGSSSIARCLPSIAVAFSVGLGFSTLGFGAGCAGEQGPSARPEVAPGPRGETTPAPLPASAETASDPLAGTAGALPEASPNTPPSNAEASPATAAPAAHWAPAPIAAFEIFRFERLSELEAQLAPVDVVTLELEEVEAAGGRTVTDRVHAAGARLICYTSAGFEDWRTDAARYPENALGSGICRNDACTSSWPGEAWGDIRRPELRDFLALRADRAAAAGCDGIEFDNMDPAFNTTGLDITPEENRAAALALAGLAHERRLAVVAKNTGELAPSLAAVFDGVFVEECEAFGECDEYLPYRGKLVAMVEYSAGCQRRDWAACNEQDDYFDADGR